MSREPKAVYVCDKITMKVLREYSNSAECSASENVPLSTVRHACEEGRISKYGKVAFRFKEDYDPEETFDGKRGRPVAVIDTENRKQILFYTPTEAANFLYVVPDSLREAIRLKIPILGRYMAKYAR